MDADLVHSVELLGAALVGDVLRKARRNSICLAQIAIRQYFPEVDRKGRKVRAGSIDDDIHHERRRHLLIRKPALHFALNQRYGAEAHLHSDWADAWHIDGCETLSEGRGSGQAKAGNCQRPFIHDLPRLKAMLAVARPQERR